MKTKFKILLAVALLGSAFTLQHKKGKWEDLSTLDSWRNFKAEGLKPQWKIDDGAIHLAEKGGGYIVTKKEYESFELQLEWKISEGGNSGIIFHVLENDQVTQPWHSGPEMQVLDNAKHPDAKIKTHRAGDNYDLQSCTEETIKPAMEWNKVKLIVDQGRVQHWLNGKKVVEYQLGSPEWEALYQKSKFKSMPLYGKGKKGRIALQDHGDKVWFRKIRVREL
jgi:Domain of Unknown Function (DUF1080)